MAGHNIDLVALHFTAQRGRRGLGHDTLAQLSRQVMRSVFVEVEFLGNLRSRQIEAHEIRAQNPDPQRLMMARKDRVRQIVKTALTGFAPRPLPLGLSVIVPLFDDLRTVAMGALNAVRPAHVADGGETFGVVH